MKDQSAELAGAEFCAGANEITGKNCSKYTFRVDLPNKVTVNAVYPLLKERGKKWYFVVASYAWGIDAYNQMKEVMVKDGGILTGLDAATGKVLKTGRLGAAGDGDGGSDGDGGVTEMARSDGDDERRWRRGSDGDGGVMETAK